MMELATEHDVGQQTSWWWKGTHSMAEDTTNINAPTLTRWLVGALTMLVMTGCGFWMNAIYGQLDRIEKTLTQRIEKIEINVETLKEHALSVLDKNSGIIVDLKIETALLKASVESAQNQIQELQRFHQKDGTSMRQGK